MGAFQSSGIGNPAPSQACVGPGCCTWDAIRLPIDGCITQLQFRTDTSGGIWGFSGITFSTIKDTLDGRPGVVYYPWHTATGVSRLTQPKNENDKNTYDINSQSNTNNSAFRIGGASSITTIVSPPEGQSQSALSGLRYNVAQSCYNIYGMIALEVRWLNLANLTQTDWIPVVANATQKIAPSSTACASGGACVGGFTQYAGADNEGKLIQQFSINWGSGSSDGLFNLFNISVLDVKGAYSYGLTATASSATPLLKYTAGEKYSMYLGSDFDKLQDSFYRNILVTQWCQASKAQDPNHVMSSLCWCKFPAEAVLSPANNIFIDRKVAESKTQQGIYSGAPPKCYLTDCKAASSGCERDAAQAYRPCAQQYATYLFTNPDITTPCPPLPPINICAVSIDVWQSTDVKVVIDKLSIDCKFNQNNLPPGCEKPENKNSPICQAFLPPGPTDCKNPANRNTADCKAYCNRPENINLPECKVTPPSPTDCKIAANRNTAYCLAYCARPENVALPECKATPIDCTDPANRNNPQCQSPGPTDCTLDVNKSLPVCYCKDAANRNTTICNTYCSLDANKGLPECATPSFWSKYKWWILGFVVLIILIIIIVAFMRRGKKKASESQTEA